MAEDRLRTLRRLAKRYRITFRLPSDDWPAAHAITFQNIKKLGDRKFDSYCESVNIRSHEEPWTEQTKHRAEWLANRASRLSGQQRNEAGWRYGLENDVMRRFSVEVACPKCRARVWRSEIEAGLEESGDLARNLEQRKMDRTRCQCSPDSRPQDYYEIGTNPLFDERAQEPIIHDHRLQSELPKQEPDRIYGLQATKNFEDLLSRSLPCTSIFNRNDPITLGDVIRSSPFRADSDPLLFPFLVLEAKSGSSPYGFDDIQTQTAFPIWALLKLQEELQSYQVGPGSSFEPLVWFLATKGDNWRVYGCSITTGTNNEPTTYDIYTLWNGSITFKDSAIQLVLIIDYILDWARDVYRPTILRHLKSIATGKMYDEISLADDSDVFSMRRNISSWIPAPPSTINTSDWDEKPDQLDALEIPIPNTKLGSLKSAADTRFRFTSLHITQSNVMSLLQLAGGRSQNTENSMRAARELVNFITKWDEMLLLTGADLDELEYIWTGEMRLNDNTVDFSSTEEFYVVLEFRCFISFSWELTKEIACLAVSKSAFEILTTYADFKNRHLGSESLPDIVRPCQIAVLRECIECLKSGSPWQVLLCAISCLLVSLYPMPERKRADFTPPVDFLEFGYRRFSRVKPFIQKFLDFNRRRVARKHHYTVVGNSENHSRIVLRHVDQSNFDQSTVDLSFQRVSDRKVHNCERAHDPEKCSRCRQSLRSDLYKINLVTVAPLIASTYGAILVESPDDQGKKPVIRHDLCLFMVEKSTLLEEQEALPLVVEDILQTDVLYHTITHSPSKDADNSRALIWNLPLSCHAPSEEQRTDIINWCHELLDRPIVSISQRKDKVDVWVYNQMLLHFLQLGSSHLDAKVAVTGFCQKFPDMLKERNELGRRLGRNWRQENPGRPITLDDFFNWVDKENGQSPYNRAWQALLTPTTFNLKGDMGRKLVLANGSAVGIMPPENT